MSVLVCKSQIGSIKEYECICTADFDTHKLKHTVGSLLRGDDAVVGLKKPTRSRKHIEGASFFGPLMVIVVALDAVEDKFVTNSGPKTAEKNKLL